MYLYSIAQGQYPMHEVVLMAVSAATLLSIKCCLVVQVPKKEEQMFGSWK